MSMIRPDRSLLYYPRMPATWWLRKRNYFLFIVREFSSVFIAAYLVVFLVQLYQLGNGAAAYSTFANTLKSPGWIVFHVVVLVFALYHSVTWFYTTSIVIPLRIGGKEIPRAAFTAINIAAWIAVSAVVFGLYLFQ